ncbi:MAG: hypothetical protein HZC52_05225 [Planctomycetes bacterium]|nr:hypothetical protein [Planctomycetota bacterium]
MIRQIGLVILSMAVLCVGCKTISVSTINVNLDPSDRSVKTIAVMRFDDKLIQDEAVKGLIMKTISNPDAGEMLADIMTDELHRWGKYRILSRSEVKNKIKTKGRRTGQIQRLRRIRQDVECGCCGHWQGIQVWTIKHDSLCARERVFYSGMY